MSVNSIKSMYFRVSQLLLDVNDNQCRTKEGEGGQFSPSSIILWGDFSDRKIGLLRPCFLDLKLLSKVQQNGKSMSRLLIVN